MANTKKFEEMTMKELKEYARSKKISCSCQINGEKHNYTKSELIDVLNGIDVKAVLNNPTDIDNEVVVDQVKEEVKETVSEVADEERVTIDDNTSLNDLLAARAEIDRLISDRKKNRTKRDPRNEEYDENFSMYGGVNPFTFTHTRNKERYLDEAEVGTLIAFLDENGKPRTAALVNRSSKRKMLKLKTEFDWEYEVPYSKVLWVKQGSRWAYGVYRILKGYNPNGRCGEDTFRQEGQED